MGSSSSHSQRLPSGRITEAPYPTNVHIVETSAPRLVGTRRNSRRAKAPDGVLGADVLASRSCHTRDLECRWLGAAMVLAPLQSARPVRPRGPPRMAAAPGAPRSRAASRRSRAAAHARGTRGDPEDPGAFHRRHGIPAGRPHCSGIRRFRHVLQRLGLDEPGAERAARFLRRGNGRGGAAQRTDGRPHLAHRARGELGAGGATPGRTERPADARGRGA